MADTNFIAGTTITSAWLNDANEATYGRVNTIAALRLLDKTRFTRAMVMGYYALGDGGGGEYYYDSSDTTSVDNGGAVIVGADNGRWKLIVRTYVTIKQFGAKGDGTTDDTAKIQAAIDWICGQTSTTVGTGGGRLFVPPGRYRITSTLYLGYGLCLEGTWAGGYPYINTNTQTSLIYVDFGASKNKWALDSQTFYSAAGGSGRVAYNEWVTDQINGSGVLGFTPTYGISIKGILLIDADASTQANVPYGAIRLNGCPNSRIENVSILGFGLGLVLGCCYGTTISKITSNTNYYGIIAYNGNNDISIQGQFDKIIAPSNLTVPVGSIPSWLASGANFVSVYHIDSSHHASAKGCMIAAAPAIGSNGADVDVILQYWPDAMFLNHSYDNTILDLYSEQCSGFVLTTAFASFNMVNGHNYSTTSPLPYFADFGYNSVGKVNVGGNNICLAFYLNCWTGFDPADLTSISVQNVSGTGGTVPSNQRLTMEFEENTWTPAVTASSGSITSVTSAVGRYTKARNVVRAEYQFTITTNGTGAGTLQVDGLPFAPRNTMIEVVFSNAAAGQAVLTSGSTQLKLFTLAGAYPGASGVTYYGTVTYLV